MKRSSAVMVGVVLTAGMSLACASGGDEYETVDADHQQICVRELPSGDLERLPDHQCDDNGSSGSSGHCSVCWYYLGRAHGTPPAVGSRLPAYSVGSAGSFARPSSGTIARPPASGGFGTTSVKVAG